MDRTRVLEIIAAYGAETTRWPSDEREAAQALIARDRMLQAELDAAAALDADLAAWALAPVGAGDVAASAAADAALAKAPPRRWWPTAVVGGSVAASLLAAVLILPTSGGGPSTAPTQVAQAPAPVAPIQTAQVEQDVQVWAAVFTLTPEEESLI